MRILLLAPHPFYQERGTPIDVLLVLRVLSERKNIFVDLVVYNEGQDVELPNVKIHRISGLKILKNVRPGFSWKKVLGNILLFFKSCQLLRQNKYDIIHADEEAVFLAMIFKYFYKIPYVYDLDSSIAQQLVEQIPYLKVFRSLLNRLEARAIQGSIANLPVCNALARLCEENGSKKTVTIHDISQLKNPDAESKGLLKKETGVDKLFLLYVGNLEPYQGIDLLLESFKIVSENNDKIDLIIIGGMKRNINKYVVMSKRLGIENRVHFLGPKPFEKLDEYLAEADIIACPRIMGMNTPMKIFPYLHSGKPVIATDLYTHNQILTSNEAYLAPAHPQGFADAIINLSLDDKLRRKLGKNGRAFIEKGHTYPAHQKRLNEVYDWIESEVSPDQKIIIQPQVQEAKKILLLAPHPFFQERGTPIAVKLLAETLCGFGYRVDILTYHEGTNIDINGLKIYRIPNLFFIKNIPIGYSWKKIVADFFFCFRLIRLVFKNKYEVIHAVEESIFPAAALNIILKKKLIYDMDSSLADQLIEKMNYLKIFQGLFDWFENIAVKKADIVVPVSKYLADKVKIYQPDKKVFLLEDIAFESNNANGYEENLREKFNLKGVIALYVGNLEHYQGIDLLLESVEKIKSSALFSVVIIGGSQRHISRYIKISKKLKISDKVHFLGPRSFKELSYYLSQADILLSPRIIGKNTPMKLYSYLASGKPILATRTDTHIQVVDDTTAKLADPRSESYSKGLQELIENDELRKTIGEAGWLLAKNNYSLDSYKLKLRRIYDQLDLSGEPGLK